MISVLVYPNITWQKDLSKDSYVVLIRNIIKHMQKIRNDIAWTVLSPGGHIESLKLKNVKQLRLDLPTYPNTMRLHFDATYISKILKWKENDYDLVYSHLPEHTLQLKNLFYNSTNVKPIFVGYSHWTELPEITNYSMTVMNYNILGLLEMEECGVNTLAQKKLIIKNAKTVFNDSVIQKLEKILQPHYLGWEIPVYDKQPVNMKKKIIVFNHRPQKYKSYDWFIAEMDKLWKQRKDFQVWVPLADKANRPYMTVDRYDRKGYFDKLSSCYVGVCGKQKYAGWAISATDGMSVGVPYLFYDAEYYRELADAFGMYFKLDEFNEKINRLLNDPIHRTTWSDLALERFAESKWDSRVRKMSDLFDLAISKLPCLKSETNAYLKIYNLIKNKGKFRKGDLMKELGWGVSIPFTAYRTLLRKNGIETYRNGFKYGETEGQN